MIDTPCGTISIIPVEQVLAGQTPVDWDEVDRLAALPSFSVAEQMAGLKAEVERELG